MVDTCGFTSRQVQATAGLLTGSVDHYTFISSISVYRDFTKSGLDESGLLEQLASGISEEESNAGTYGARKALCEQAAEDAMPNRVLNVRPGMIVGPHDPSGRFLYWVRRIDGGGELLAPGHPAASLQLIDVRDLAEWIIRMVESRNVGVYNATGPTLTFQQMLEHCRKASCSSAQITWVDEQFLLEQGLTPFTDLPFWLPKTHHGFFEIDCHRAFESGLALRPLSETAIDILAWNRSRLEEAGQPGLELTREGELLRGWKSRLPNEIA